jgi:hypothetical protein
MTIISSVNISTSYDHLAIILRMRVTLTLILGILYEDHNNFCYISTSYDHLSIILRIRVTLTLVLGILYDDHNMFFEYHHFLRSSLRSFLG